MFRQRHEESSVHTEKLSESGEKKIWFFPKGDILFGVLEESQVRIDPPTGRWNIAKEVLEEMRRYLAVDTGESKTVKVDKIQKSVKFEICTEIGTTPAGYF